MLTVLPISFLDIPIHSSQNAIRVERDIPEPTTANDAPGQSASSPALTVPQMNAYMSTSTANNVEITIDKSDRIPMQRVCLPRVRLSIASLFMIARFGEIDLDR